MLTCVSSTNRRGHERCCMSLLSRVRSTLLEKNVGIRRPEGDTDLRMSQAGNLARARPLGAEAKLNGNACCGSCRPEHFFKLPVLLMKPLVKVHCARAPNKCRCG